MSRSYTYSPGSIVVVACGIPILAFEEVMVEDNEETYTLKTGTSSATRSKKLVRPGKLTLTLNAKAPENALLSALYTLDNNAANGAGVLPSSVKDLAGTDTHVMTESYISKKPQFKAGQELDDKVWEITFMNNVGSY